MRHITDESHHDSLLACAPSDEISAREPSFHIDHDVFWHYMKETDNLIGRVHMTIGDFNIIVGQGGTTFQVIVVTLFRCCEVLCRLGSLALLQELLVQLHDCETTHLTMVVLLAASCLLTLGVGSFAAPRNPPNLTRLDIYWDPRPKPKSATLILSGVLT